MRKIEKELFLSYIINQRERFDIELQEQQRRIRYRRIDVVDLVEYLLLLERISSFEEFVSNALALLHLTSDFIQEDDKNAL